MPTLYGEHFLKFFPVLGQQISGLEVHTNIVRCMKYYVKDKFVSFPYHEGV
jgi:hypothetical protein